MHEVDLDAPAEPQTRSVTEPRLRRSAGLVAAGTVLLAVQQVLGPMISFRLFAGGDSAMSETWADTWTVVFIGSFVLGVSLLVVGGFRFTAHVRVLAEQALQRG